MTTDRVVTAVDDAEFWGLDWRERKDFFGRIDGYHRRQLLSFTERAAASGRKSERLSTLMLVLAGLTLVFALLSAWVGSQ